MFDGKPVNVVDFYPKKLIPYNKRDDPFGDIIFLIIERL
jgi:hypothetical protein